MNPTNPAELDVPTIMRIGAARMTAGLDRLPPLDLAAHNEIFGPLPRLSAEDLVAIASQVDLRGQGGAAFPFARKLKAVMDTARKTGQPTIVVVNATEGEPGLHSMMRVVQQPDRFISGESGALVRGINGKKPVPPGRKTLASDKGVADLPTP